MGTKAALSAADGKRAPGPYETPSGQLSRTWGGREDSTNVLTP